MSKSKKNVIEPDEILKNFGIDATRIFMISDSPPDRELEWTDEGIQSSKNLINRIERYFQNEKSSINQESTKIVEKFVKNIEDNILNFSLNKCVAEIYTLFNYLEKNKIYLFDDELSKKILICLYPIAPRMVTNISLSLLNEEISNYHWPKIDIALLEDDHLVLPIQIKGKLITTIETKKDYNEDELLVDILKIDKVNHKLSGKNILKVINVQNKIINIITN